MKTSVLISNYNYGEFLPKAIESVLNQSVPAHQIIVVDDGSTDNSADVIASYGTQITPLFQDNSGQAATISNAVSIASGDILMLLDADDMFHPHKIEILQEVYKEYPDIGWVFHDLKEVYSDKANLEDIPISKDITPKMVDQRRVFTTGRIGYDAPATSGLSFRKEFMSDFFPMPKAPGISLSDHYIKFYCLAVGKGFHIPEPLGLQVVHDKNLYTGKKSRKALATRARIFANTALYLEKIAPHTENFCNNLMSEAVKCAIASGITSEIKPKFKVFTADKSSMTVIKMQAKSYINHFLQR